MITFDAVSDLEQAADRLDKLGVDQRQIANLTKRVTRTEEERLTRDKGGPSAKYQNHMWEIKHQANEQSDLEQQIVSSIDKIIALLPKLSPALQERVRTMEKRIVEEQFREQLHAIVPKLKIASATKARVAEWRRANDWQGKSVVALTELAKILRAPASNIQLLQDAIRKIDATIAGQQNLTNEIQGQQEKLTQDLARTSPPFGKMPAKKDGPFNPKSGKNPDSDLFPNQRQAEQAREKLQALAKDQSRLEADTAGIRDMVAPIAKDAADELSQVEKEMQAAKTLWRKPSSTPSIPPQQKATEELKKIRDDLVKQIAQQKRDLENPIVQLRKLEKDLDRIIENQKETREVTKDAMDETENDAENAELARKQESLAHRSYGTAKTTAARSEGPG